MDPQQELFTAIRQRLCEEYGEGDPGDVLHSGKVYDSGLPPDETPYPFIYLGDSRMQDDYGNKSVVLANVYQTIHVWHNNPRQRGTVSRMLAEIKAICRSIRRTSTYAWDIRDVNQQIIPDNTTNTPLLHGVLELEYKLSGG